MRLRQGAAALAAWLVAAAAWAQAQNYPNRPVRVVVAAATGGPDIVARVVAAKLQEQMGQAFVVENQPGANGIVGATTVAKAPPDGYTLLVYSSGFVINPYVHKSLPYDTEKDFAPVTNLVTNGGLFFAVANSVPAKTMQEFLAYAKRPDVHLAYSTPGVGNTWHLATEVFDNTVGIKMTHIPYKGGGPATAALAAGEVQAMFASPPPLLSHYKAGKVRVLAFTGDKRHPQAPEVPTMKELGIRHRRQALARGAHRNAGRRRARSAQQARCRAGRRLAGRLPQIHPGRAQGLWRAGKAGAHRPRIIRLKGPCQPAARPSA
ncbi:MAG: tripartite tricarboxylate transporter substrate binding protein [Betaproteobacteria bacterium]|nr:MAG: tripartite tricarboxylate transporter substrate binding protein [Betaproteobacteria bacterium]